MKDAHDKARAHECVLEAMEKRSRGPTKSVVAGPSVTKRDSVPYVERAKGQFQSGGLKDSKPIRRLSYNEFKDRMAKGLCIHCDEKYVSGHSCRSKQLFMLTEETPMEHSTETGELSIIWEDPVAEAELVEEDSEVFIHVISGTNGLHTLQIQGTKEGKHITMLIDSGSTHNFVSPSLVKQLHLPRVPCSPVSVLVANGEKLQSTQQVTSFSWQMQGETFEAPMLVLPIKGYDAILGVNWMKQVSPVVFDFCNGSILVTLQGQKVELKHCSKPSRVEVVNAEDKRRWVHKDDCCFLIQVKAVETPPSTPDLITPPAIQQVLDDYTDVFSEPTGLPPKRTHDHKIPLKPDSNPVNNNPYKCPYVHKQEIEKIVKEMLKSGIVRHSSSPFASPVLLVKKKDNS